MMFMYNQVILMNTMKRGSERRLTNTSNWFTYHRIVNYQHKEQHKKSSTSNAIVITAHSNQGPTLNN